MEEKKEIEAPQFAVVKFSDSKVPLFKETKNKDFILYGENNKYPEYLTYLFDKSAKHNAIITGKAAYVYGKGFPNGDFPINRMGDTLNDLTQKAALDIETYGGFKWELIYNYLGQIAEIYHTDYTTIRKAKSGGFYYKESWGNEFDRDSGEFIPAFKPGTITESQIFEYNEYRPMTRFYPLPGYIGCNNYIETDIEISKFHLSSIRNGMMPSKMIQFFKGEPTEDKKQEVEKRLARKFAGSENAGNFLLVFNDANSTQSKVTVDDLSANELDKQFDILNKTCQQEIFSGHRVTSPMLFGIKEEGQLGGNTELATAYAIFLNTYSKPKAKALSKEIQELLNYTSFKGQYELQPTDPIGVIINPHDVVNSLPKKFVFENLGVPPEDWDGENIGADNRPTQTIPIAPATTIGQPDPAALAANPPAPVNENIKNLTAKQHQQMLRIIRQYTKGLLTAATAKILLRQGLGLPDKDINEILGIPAAAGAMSFDAEEDRIIGMFDAAGESKNDYQIVKSKPVSFGTDVEAEFDEEVYIKEAFLTTTDLSVSEGRILDLIKKDKLISPETIAGLIQETVAYVQGKIDSLITRGYIQQTTTSDGVDDIIERVIVEQPLIPPTTIDNTPISKISIMYSYEGPQDSKNRPFCARMMELRRLYTRKDIEDISARLGYSVFDRRGGFWTRKGTHDTTPYCRHTWKSNIVIKKG